MAALCESGGGVVAAARATTPQPGHPVAISDGGLRCNPRRRAAAPARPGGAGCVDGAAPHRARAGERELGTVLEVFRDGDPVSLLSVLDNGFASDSQLITAPEQCLR